MASAPLKKAGRRGKSTVKHRERAFRRSPLPLYGLEPAWPGGRFLGGFSSSVARRHITVHAVSLVHGSLIDSDDQPPSLTVESADPSDHGPGGGPLRGFAEGAWVIEEDPSIKRDAALWDEVELPETPTRHEATLKIDDETYPADVFVMGNRWVGRALVNGVVVTVESRGFPLAGLHLVRITDVTPYIEGSRMLLKRWEQKARDHTHET